MVPMTEVFTVFTGLWLIVNRGCGTSQVIDLIHLDQHRFSHIVSQQFKVGVAHQMGNVFAPAGKKIVEANHLMPVLEQPLAKMRAQKPRTTGNQDSLL